jgi:hypothetical protein
LLKIIWAFGAVIVAYSTTPYISLHFTTPTPSSNFRITQDECDTGIDAIEHTSRDIAPGRSVSTELCFKSQLFSSNQRQLVPYKVDSNGTMWGNSPYSTEVSTYTKMRAENFVLSDTDRQSALTEWNSQWWRKVRNGVFIAIGGWIGLSILQALIGWIVRGFAGIPWGKDRRPELPTSGLS